MRSIRLLGCLVAAVLAVGWPAPQPAGATSYVTCPAAAYGAHHYAPGSGKTVALTFDDGPGRDTAQIMRILAGAHVEATFFNLGLNETAMPRRVAAEHRAGFALGDHTWDHQDLTQLDAAGQAREIDRERAEQASITGRYSCLFRPPFGSFNDTTLELAQARGMRVWNWSVDTEDWKAAGSDDAYWVRRIIARAEAGSSLLNPVILMHNQTGGNPATVAALPTIISYYKDRGYRFVDLYGHTGHPFVRRIAPATDSSAGGTRVTVSGHGFLGVQAVRFGSAAGASVHVVSATQLMVTAPAHAIGRVHVRVVTTFGASPARAADLFTYVPS
jgi:peptidoglycan/xylan/chitin deacetylase (PgdA/CDA1 family)